VPRHCSADSPPLCDTVRHGQQPPRGTVPPTPVRPTHRTLERGQRNPRRDDTPLLCARTGRRHDVKPAGTVFSVAISPVRPSLPLQRHFSTTPATAPPCLTLWKHAAKGHRHASHCTLYGPVSMAPSNPHADSPLRHSPRNHSWRRTGRAMMLARSGIHQDNHLLHGTVRHASTRRRNSVARL
jgi:hypothetical protein